MKTQRVNSKVTGDLPKYLTQTPVRYVWYTFLTILLLPVAIAVALTKPFYLLARNLYLTVVNVIFPNPYRQVQLDRMYSTFLKFRAKGMWVDGVGFCYPETLAFNLRGSDETHLLYINDRLSRMCMCQRSKEIIRVDHSYCSCVKFPPNGSNESTFKEF